MGALFGQSGANPFALQLLQTLGPYLAGNFRAQPSQGLAFGGGAGPVRSVTTVQGTPYDAAADARFQASMNGLSPAGTQDWLNQWANLRSTYSTLYSPQVYEQLMRNQLLGSRGGQQISDNTTALSWQLQDIVAGHAPRTDASGNYLLPNRDAQGGVTQWFTSSNPFGTLGRWNLFQPPNDAIPQPPTTQPAQLHYDPPPPPPGYEAPGQATATYLGQPAPQIRTQRLLNSNLSNPFKLF